MMTNLCLLFAEDNLEEIGDKDGLEALRPFFHLEAVDKLSATDTAKAGRLAESLAEALEDVCLSSDEDAEFVACLVRTKDSTPIDVESLVPLAGISNSDLVTHVDGEVPRFVLEPKNQPFIQALLGLDEDEMQELEEYLDEDELKACKNAEKKLKGAKIRAVVLTVDAVTKIRFCLAQFADDTLAGVAARQVDA